MAVFAPGEDVARLTFFGLHSLQHRGQESAGIATAEGGAIHRFAEMGLVTQIFHEDVLQGLGGGHAIGHTRYSTSGSSVPRTRSRSWSRGRTASSRSPTTATS